MEEKRKQFTVALKSLVNKSGMQQKEIAEDLGISPKTFNNWLNGISEPSIENISKLAEYFDCDTDELLGQSNGLSSELMLTLEGTKTVILLEKMSPNQQKALYQYAKLLMDSNK